MSDDVHALAAAYALDALDPMERRRFEAHYPGCPECREEVAGFRETAARLSATAPSPLPPDLKARVMAEVAATRQLPPRVTPPGRRRRPAVLVSAAAAAVLVVALVGAFVALDGSGGSSADQELASVLAASDAVTVELAGEGDATMRVVYSASRDEAVLVGSELDEVPRDRTYQLWSLAEGAPSSAGVFRPGEDGDVTEIMDPPGTSPDAWAVTVEPEGGSPAPTGEILFQGTPA